MNTNDNRQHHRMWHYSSEFLLEADALTGHRILSPRTMRCARRFLRNCTGTPAPLAMTVRLLGDERFNPTRSVEVVPLGCYTSWHGMVQGMREHFQASVVSEIECDDRGIVSASWNSESFLTEGLDHVVTVVSCCGKCFPMLITGRHGK